MVWSLYFQTVLWITPMFCPLFVWLVPILLYVLFHYSAFAVRRFYAPSTELAHSSDDQTIYLIFIFTNIVFVGAISGSYGYYLLRNVTHSCGAFYGMTYAIDVLYDQTTVLST